MSSLQPRKEHKFTFGLWTVGNPGRDPFGDPTRNPISPVTIVQRLSELGAYGVNFHDNDLVPIDATPAERDQVIKQSAFYGHYEKVVDRESAYEMLKTRAPQAGQTRTPSSSTWQSEAGSLLEAAGKSAVRAMGTQVGREIIRGVLGSIFGSSTRKRR